MLKWGMVSRKENVMTKRILAYGVLLIAVLIFLLGYRKQLMHSQQTDIPTIDSLVMGHSVSGNYLAARFATGIDDLTAASRFFGHAIDEAKDKKDLVQRAIPTAIGAGDIKAALALAEKIDLKEPTLTTQLAITLLTVEAFKNQDHAKIAKYLPLIREDGFGRLLLPILQSWSLVLEDKTDVSLQALDDIIKKYPTAQSLFVAQKAMIFDATKQSEQAGKHYEKSFSDNLSLRSAWLIAEFYERAGQLDKAKEVYHKITDKIPDAPLPQLALERLVKGQLLADDPITVQDGVAAALYDIASVLYQEGSNRMAVLYGQMAYYLAPNDPFINLLLGDIFSSSQVKTAAVSFYEAVDAKRDLYILAQLRLANLYEHEGDDEQSLQILTNLANTPLVRRQAISEIADMYRRREEFEKAIPYYNEILDAINEPQENDWALFYARAICLERVGKMDKSESDLQQALKLSPNQPEVLNYLAYTWADHGKNLEKALDMLQRALAGSPQDPYISDSVGWAMYRMNRFEQALPYIETSVLGLPDDATVNDHLGDVYWRLDRHMEAEFQWKRALKYVSPKDIKMKRAIKTKIRKGLPPLENTSKKD
jgi:tetratricopeptide (TPR) repeat protein